MKLPRRNFLHLAAGVAALPAVSRIAWAQSYPTRSVRIVVGFPAGTSSDITARLTGQWLSERLGQQFIVENRTGAGTNIAADAVVHAAADGYTLLWVTQTNAINASIYKTLNFNFIRDIEPVASIIHVPAVMMVHPSVLANTVPEFITYAKANPGKINMSTPGIGSINHVAGELFNMMAGVDLIAVHYRSSQFPDLLSGQVQVTFNPLPSSLEFIRAGKLRALAVTSAMRQEVLPDTPTVAQYLPGYEATAWFGIGTPKNTPNEILKKLNGEINAGLVDPQFNARLVDLGGTPSPMTPEDFRKLIAEETEKWAKVVKFAGIKPE
ncbi:MAG TPA: tripartite tricarboxylate transporter substrate binding protein [Lacipirellulaceae bacterium]|nr:tripartite tricarboxylate transporter substrate binding protein [Lacipirellulaceae bacterium]